MSNNEDGGIEKKPPFLFATEEFAIVHRDLFDQYIEYRIHGYHTSTAFKRVFGAENYDGNAHIRIENMEHNPYYKSRFAQRLNEVKTTELWNTKISLNELLSSARNPFAKDSVRLNAIKELNIMCGITVVDESGKTKAGRSLEDFYRMEAGQDALPESPSPTTHH